MTDYGGATTMSDNDSQQSPPNSMCLLLSPITPHTTTSQSDPNSMGEILRKPRGRPPGSKNRPKPPIFITRDPDHATLIPAVLQIAAGSDVIVQLLHYARSRSVGIAVLSGSGSVSSVTLRQPMAHHSAPSLALHGPLTLVGLSGSYLGPSSAVKPDSCFSVLLAGSQGQVFGGIVAGEMTAQTAIVIVAATFSGPSFHRLPEDNDGGDEAGGGVDEEDDSKGGESRGTAAAAAGIYNVAAGLNGHDLFNWGSSARHNPYH